MTLPTQASADRIGNTPVLAFDFGGSKTAIALFAPNGEIEQYERLPVDEQTADDVLAAAGAKGRQLLHGLDRIQRERVRVAAVCPGVVLDDRVLLAPNVAGWDRVALSKQMSNELEGRLVTVGNDVKAAALAEYNEGNLTGCDSGLYVNLGTGVAVATVIDGKVIRGRCGLAGEVGYNFRMGVGEPMTAQPAEPATLESICGARAIVKEAQRRGCDLADVSVLLDMMDTSPTARSVVERAFGELVRQLVSMIHLVDPHRIVIGGGVIASGHIVLPLITQLLRESTTSIREVVAEWDDGFLMVSAFGTRASLHGARWLALQDR